MMTIARLDDVGLNISISFPQQSPEIKFDKRTFDSIPKDMNRTTSDISTRNKILYQNRAIFWDDTEETYEEMRFVVNRKLLRRRHVRKEQKRLRMKQRSSKLESRVVGSRQRTISNNTVPNENIAVNGEKEGLTDLKLGQICKQSSTNTDPGFHTISNEVKCINNLHPAPVSTEKGSHHIRKRADGSQLNNLTVTPKVSLVQTNKRRKSA